MRHRLRRCGAPIVLLVCAALASGAFAAEPTAADRETARTLLLDGRAKLTAGDAQGALKSFRAAHAIMGVPTTGLDVAKALVALGRLIEARAVALDVARLPPAPREPEAFADARAAAAQLAEQLVARIPALVIEVKALPAGTNAQVTVDGALVPPEALALPWKVDPGDHVVAAAATGHRAERRTVRVHEGQSAWVEIALVPRRPRRQDASRLPWRRQVDPPRGRHHRLPGPSAVELRCRRGRGCRGLRGWRRSGWGLRSRRITRACGARRRRIALATRAIQGAMTLRESTT